MGTLSTSVLSFLSDLKKNNNREWFNEHKPRYKAAHEEAKSFFASLHQGLSEIDEVEPPKLMRIYRDIRFSKDKTPYKAKFAGGFQRIGAERRGGYYLQIGPGESAIACGFWGPEKDDLYRIRKEIELQPEDLLSALDDRELKSFFGEIQGEGLKTAPRGFDKHHPHVDLLRKKQFYFARTLTDKEVKSSDIQDVILEGYRVIRPFFDIMSEILTTDLNGENV